ncbi:DNA-binding protein [Halomonas sp. 141]|nr:DNA-binding protein [Halomonas sp. 141]
MLKPGGYYFGASKMYYDKPPIPIEQQVSLLRKRGMNVPDTARAEHYLTHIGYYRLSAYWLPFEEPNALADVGRTHRFVAGTSFDDVLQHYIFDRELRLICLEALERVEVSLRSLWVNAFALQKGPHAYLDAQYFHCPYKHAKQVARAANDLQDNEEAFVKHYRQKYRGAGLPPIWIMAETLTFGALSQWVELTMPTEIKKVVIQQLDLPTIEIAQGIFHNLSQLRNVCAHHARLWNRRFSKKYPHIRRMPLLLHPETSGEQARYIYNHFVMLGHLMVVINPGTSWPRRLYSLLEKQTEATHVAMHLPDHWRTALAATGPKGSFK